MASPARPGQNLPQRQASACAVRYAEAARAKIDKGREEILATSASELAQALGSFLSPADARRAALVECGQGRAGVDVPRLAGRDPRS